MMPQPKQPQSQSQPPESPTPSPSPSPSPSDEASGASSATGSSASGFLADPGPAFDPKQAPEAPALVNDELAIEPEGWQEETVRSLLVTQGNITHAALKAGPNDTETWKQTQDDLNAIAPPLTRMLNRYDATRAAAAAGDEIALGAALVAYGAKNYTKRRRLLAEIAAQGGPEPITGVSADEGVGPAYDLEYQRVHEPPPALKPKGIR